MLVGILIGLLLGLGIALAVAIYLNKVPGPFLTRGHQCKTREPGRLVFDQERHRVVVAVERGAQLAQIESDQMRR